MTLKKNKFLLTKNKKYFINFIMPRYYDFRTVFPDDSINKDFAQDEFPHLYNYFSLDGNRIFVRQSRGFYEVICSWKPAIYVTERRIGFSKEYLTYKGKFFKSALANFRCMCYSLLNKYKHLPKESELERQNLFNVQSFKQPLF